MSAGKNVAILATGSPDGGGSGASKLFEHEVIKNRVAALVTNYPNGGVAQLATQYPDIALKVWKNFPKRSKKSPLEEKGMVGQVCYNIVKKLGLNKILPAQWQMRPSGFTKAQEKEIAQMYLDLVREFGLEYIFLSGWVKQILGLEANKVVNIHPGPLGKYGGEKMYGDNVHEKVWRDYFDGKIVSSAVTMHFVPSGPDDKMDTGPIIVQVPVSLVGCTTQKEVKERVNQMEHKIQWQVTEHVINGKITWSGVEGEPVQFESGLTINIDGTPFTLDGKAADLSVGKGYGHEVVYLGDQASGNFKEACDRAMKTTPAFEEGLVQQTATGAWETIIPPSESPTRVKEDIDGVGTKVQIYLEMFEGLCQDYRDGKISQEECTQKAQEMCWVPMLHDLIAMNADDLRDGQMAVSVTNIIDINHLGGERGRIFSASMAAAMEQATSEIGIGNVAGETAVLGEGRSTRAYKLGASILARVLKELPNPTEEQKAYIEKHLAEHSARITDIENCIDLNIGGTVQGLMKGEKLVPLEEGHVLVALYEQPDKNGIIGPRSNGISSIRKHMENLAGRPDWATMTFEDFLKHIGDEQATKLPAALKAQCSKLLLGQIATGTTTVFNPFISRDLLGGMNGDPKVQISSIVNVTGNPGKKIKNGLRGADDLAIDMDISKATIPQVIQIIQHLTEMSDKEAMESWNMGVPQVVACPPSEVEKIIQKGQENGRNIKAEKIGTVIKKEAGKPSTTIAGVGVGKKTITVD